MMGESSSARRHSRERRQHSVHLEDHCVGRNAIVVGSRE